MNAPESLVEKEAVYFTARLNALRAKCHSINNRRMIARHLSRKTSGSVYQFSSEPREINKIVRSKIVLKVAVNVA